jgi:hypothetical protein
MRARVLPAAAISASCVGRTLMIENSAATKKPFAMMKSKARSRYQVGILTERGGLTRCEMGQRPYGDRYCMSRFVWGGGGARGCHPETAGGHEVPEDVEGPPDYLRRLRKAPSLPAQREGGSFDRPPPLRALRRLRMTVMWPQPRRAFSKTVGMTSRRPARWRL